MIDVSKYSKKYGKNGRNNWGSMVPEGVFLSNDLKVAANYEEQWQQTMLALENYMTNDLGKFTDCEFLNKTAAYFGREEESVGENLTRWIRMRDRWNDGMTDFRSRFDKEQLKQINEIVDTTGISQVTTIDSELKLSRYGVDTFMLTKVLKLVTNNLDKLVKTLTAAVDEELIAPEVVAAIKDLGFNIEPDRPDPDADKYFLQNMKKNQKKTEKLIPGTVSGFYTAGKKEEKTSSFAKFRKDEDDDYFVDDGSFGRFGGGLFGGDYGSGYGSGYSGSSPFGSKKKSTFGEKYETNTYANKYKPNNGLGYGSSSGSSGKKGFESIFGNKGGSSSNGGVRPWVTPGIATESKPYVPLKPRTNASVNKWW